VWKIVAAGPRGAVQFLRHPAEVLYEQNALIVLLPRNGSSDGSRFNPSAMMLDDPTEEGWDAMKNLFEREAVDELLARIDQLQPTSQRQWGKMEVAQMIAHCSAALDMASGRLNPPRMLLGRLIGPLVKPVYTNEKPFSPNSPTDKRLIVSDQRDFTREQEQLRAKVRQFHEGGEGLCTKHPHPFFGVLTPQQWSRGMYKHLDHHLRQFET
jgi:hypothetical protein